jgi:hypothetical protein
LLGGESRAHGRHGIAEPRLMELDHIKGPLHQQGLAGAVDGCGGLIEAKEQLRFLEQQIG